ncbi:MAG: CDP-alcohol phosphatidyltransferase family protein [Parachlamydiaceae bacterium]|nr:CDP-alcohol phosphatidyltransferase family protein [Parachlamydiaceae bacterium]
MIDSYCRHVYQKACVEPIIPFFRRLSPQTLTLTSCFIGLLVCPLIIFDFPLFAILALLLSGFLDTLDGSLARYLNLVSSKGAALDIVCDRVVEFAVIMGLFFVDANARAFPSLLMLGSILLCITTFLVVGIFTENQSMKSFYYSPGLIERGEAFIFFSIMILFPSTFMVSAYLFSVLTFYTAIFRLWAFMKS